MTGIRQPDKRDKQAANRNRGSIRWNQCTLFVLCSQYVLFRNEVLACFIP